jgi:hypothetical protein
MAPLPRLALGSSDRQSDKILIFYRGISKNGVDNECCPRDSCATSKRITVILYPPCEITKNGLAVGNRTRVSGVTILCNKLLYYNQHNDHPSLSIVERLGWGEGVSSLLKKNDSNKSKEIIYVCYLYTNWRYGRQPRNRTPITISV